MFEPQLQEFERQSAIIVSAMKLHAGVREILRPKSDQGQAADLGPIQALRENAPPPTEWRVYDHCAAYTRLYALYEQFIHDLVCGWLEELAQIRKTYASLPEPLRKAHRVGVAEMLSKFGPGSRYEKFGELGIISGFHDGVAGKYPYGLIPDAFFIGDQNLRHRRLIEVFQKVGIDDCERWLSEHNTIRSVLTDTFDGETIESRLSDFVLRRNEAAHSSVEDIVAPNEFEAVSQLICSVARSMREMVCWHITQCSIEVGTAVKIGSVLERLDKKGVVIVNCPTQELKVGDSVVFYRDCEWSTSVIESIRLDNNDVPSIVNCGEREIGLKIAGIVPKKRSTMAILIKSSNSTPAGEPATLGANRSEKANGESHPLRGSSQGRKGRKRDVDIAPRDGLAWLAKLGNWCLSIAQRP